MEINSILFRCSSLGHLMTEPQGKSPMQKWNDAKVLRQKYSDEYDAIEVKSSRKAQAKLFQLQKTNLLITELVSKIQDVHLSETCITNLADVYVTEKYSRREDKSNKFIEKGNSCEEDAITAVSIVTGKMYKKNTLRLKNHWIQGEPDLFLGDELIKATAITDTKTSWSAFTYFRTKIKELNPLYYWQGQGYMWLTGATTHTVAYCLVNSTDKIIMDEKYKLLRKMEIIDLDSVRSNEPEKYDKYISKCKQIEINHIFDLLLFQKHYPYFDFDNDTADWSYDIPLKERVNLITFDRNEEDIERLKKRIEEGRKYIQENFIDEKK